MIYIGAGFDFATIRRKYNDYKILSYQKVSNEVKDLQRFIYVDKQPNDKKIFETLEQFLIYIEINLRMLCFKIESKKLVKDEKYVEYTLTFLNHAPIKLVYIFSTCFTKIPDKFKKNCKLIFIKRLPNWITNNLILQTFPNVRKIVSWHRKFQEDENHDHDFVRILE